MASTTTLSTPASSLTRALDEIGDKWCLLIIQEVFWGINTFSGMLDATGISRGVLSDRLKWLQGIDCLQKRRPPTGGSAGAARGGTYHLTRKSLTLHSCAMMAIAWERRHYRTPALDSLQLVHATCGGVFVPAMRCSQCREPVRGQAVSYRQGPGAALDTRGKKVRRRSSLSSLDVPGEHSVYRNLIDLVGDRWTANVIALAFHGPARFDDLHRRLPIATNILSDRLKLLEQRGILQVRPYQARPQRHEYTLTPKGWDLYPYFLALLQWGDRWCDPRQLGPPMRLRHTPCGQALHGEVVCDQCREPLTPFAVRVTLDKGLAHYV